jgi:hypothetical protein
MGGFREMAERKAKAPRGGKRDKAAGKPEGGDCLPERLEDDAGAAAEAGSDGGPEDGVDGSLEPPKPRRGRRPNMYPPETEDKVMRLSQYGIPQKHIAEIVEIPERTLRARFGGALKRGHALACAKIAQTLFQKAFNGDTACLIFWAKSQLGWSEARRQVDIVSSDKSMSPARQTIGGAELDRLERLCDRMDWRADEAASYPNGGGQDKTGRLLS